MTDVTPGAAYRMAKLAGSVASSAVPGTAAAAEVVLQGDVLAPCERVMAVLLSGGDRGAGFDLPDAGLQGGVLRREVPARELPGVLARAGDRPGPPGRPANCRAWRIAYVQ
jgi:hypothetical protein